MLDHLNNDMAAQRPSSPPSIPVESGSKCSSNAVYVWLHWDAESTALMRAAGEAAQLESFRLSDIRRTPSDPNLWRCRFEQAEIVPDLEQRTRALLTRLSAIGTWVRAEQVYERSFIIDHGLDEYLWDAFVRRPLP